MARFDRAAQRAARCEQTALTDHFIQRAGPDALGQRTHRGAVHAEQVGFVGQFVLRLGHRCILTASVAGDAKSFTSPLAGEVDALARRERGERRQQS